MALVCPSDPVENDANTDSCRCDSLPQSGQGAVSSIWLMDLSLSKAQVQTWQVYS